MTDISSGRALSGSITLNCSLMSEPLTRDTVKRYLSQLQRIDAAVIGVPWREEHWMLELPSKWELSRIVMASESPCGFLVASLKERTVHCHRIAVAPELYRQGVGSILVRAVAALAVGRGAEAFTVKVHRTNARSLAFLQRAGFAAAAQEGDNLLLAAPPDRVARWT